MRKRLLILVAFALVPQAYGLDLPPNTWVMANPAQETEARGLSGMTWDSIHNQVLMFGGGDRGWWGNQVSVYDVDSNTWRDAYPPEPISDYELFPCSLNTQAVTPGGLPWVRHTDDNLAFDSAAGVMVLHGGIEGANCDHGTDNTWIYDPSVPYAPSASPPTNPWTWMNPTQKGDAGPNAATSMVYDPDDDVLIQYGGNGGTKSTWIYDLKTNTWTERTPSPNPSYRSSPSMKYDSINRKVILFGGYFGTNTLGDTWAYDVPSDTWTEMTPVASPPPRLGHAMAFDSTHGVMVLWGGEDSLGQTFFADTWVYDYALNSWTMLDPSQAPAPNVPRGSMVYDPGHDVVILASYLCAQWEWNSFMGNCYTQTWWFRYDPHAPVASPTPTPTVTPTATSPAGCVGDCDGNGRVTVDELILGVNITLGSTTINTCPSLDRNNDRQVSIDELIGAVNEALNSCS